MPLSCERGELRGLESDLFTGGLPTTDDRVFITLRRADGSFSDVSCQGAGDRAPPSERVEVFGNGRTGQPRSVSSLVERLQELHPRGVAIGGVLGARHFHAELDLMGLPRLDVSVHCPERQADVAFVKRLDPALDATSDPAEPARLVVHFVRHRKPLFEPDAAGLPWADPVECLLDLQEAQLEPQAAEFVRAMRARDQEAR